MKKPTFNVRALARAALIAGAYLALCLLLAPISYGSLQVRLSEALCVLPLFFPEAVPALGVGCLLANLLGPGAGILDVIFGSAATLLAAILTWLTRRQNKVLSLCWPVLVNALVVSAILHVSAGAPYLVTALWVGLGQAVAVYGVGLPLCLALEKRQNRNGKGRLF